MANLQFRHYVVLYRRGSETLISQIRGFNRRNEAASAVKHARNRAKLVSREEVAQYFDLLRAQIAEAEAAAKQPAAQEPVNRPATSEEQQVTFSENFVKTLFPASDELEKRIDNHIVE